jgi:excisionase family DNA binding protein
MEDAERLLTVEEVAVILRMNIKTVYKYVRSGDLPGFRVGTHAWRFKRSDIDAMMNKRAVSE